MAKPSPVTDAGRTVPLTPQQCWFFEQGYAEPKTIVVCQLLELAELLDEAVLDRVAAQLLGLHDAVRVSFRDGDEGVTAWLHDSLDPKLLIRPPLKSDDQPLEQLADSAAAQITACWDGVSVPLFALQPLTGFSHRHGLLLVAHHLLVDAVSMRLLQRSITTALEGGSSGLLTAPSSLSCAEWADRLSGWACSPALLAGELEYWRGQVNGEPEPGWLPAQDGRALWLELSDEQTYGLAQLSRSRQVFMGEAFLGLLHQAFASPTTGGRPLIEIDGTTDVFGIGRRSPFPACRVDRTVSWLATRYPVQLEPAKTALVETIADAARALRAVPNAGIGYEVLRFLAPADLRDTVASRRGLSYNCVGRIGHVPSGSAVIGCQPVRLPAKSDYRCPPWISINAALEVARLRAKVAGPAAVLDDFRCSRLPR